MSESLHETAGSPLLRLPPWEAQQKILSRAHEEETGGDCTTQHRLYCDMALHAHTLGVCILSQDKGVLLARR